MLSPDQQNASDKFMDFLFDDSKSEIVISGSAGVGKSYLTQHLIKSAESNVKLLSLLTDEHNEVNIHTTATTNKAAKILRDMTGESSTGTIHSLLGLKVTNNFQTGKVTLRRSRDSKIIENSLIFVDEASMNNMELLNITRQATHNCKVVYIGDSYQLAPVFEDTCPVFTKIKNQVKLTTPQRQAANSPIIQLASSFRETIDTSEFTSMDAFGDAIQIVDGPTFQKLMTESFMDNNSIYDEHSKVLAWTNSRVHQYNNFIRGLSISSTDPQIGELVVTNNPVIQGKMTFFKTDEIIRITSVKEDIQYGIDGYFLGLNDKVVVFAPKEQYKVNIQLKQLAKQKDWPTYFERKDYFADLRPVHASTVHKSQGSTYNTVFIDLPDIGDNNKWNEVARLMYVAITRASHKVIMTGRLPKKYGG